MKKNNVIGEIETVHNLPKYSILQQENVGMLFANLNRFLIHKHKNVLFLIKIHLASVLLISLIGILLISNANNALVKLQNSTMNQVDAENANHIINGIPY